MKRKQEMLKTALFAVCQPHTCTGAATRGHCWNFERGAGNEKRQVPSVVFSGGAVGLQLKFRRKNSDREHKGGCGNFYHCLERPTDVGEMGVPGTRTAGKKALRPEPLGLLNPLLKIPMLGFPWWPSG